MKGTGQRTEASQHVMRAHPGFRSVAIVLWLSLVLVAVANAGSADYASPVPTPLTRDAGDVILRMETMGGFVPFEATLLGVPTFTLYADGLVLYRPAPHPRADVRIDTPLRQSALSEDQVAELMEFALVTAGLVHAREQYSVQGVADASTTVFSVRSGSLHKQVSVYGLGFDERGPDRGAYHDFEQFAGVLADFDAWLPDDAEVLTYRPASYLGVFAEEDPERAALIPWPWEDLSPTDLEPLAEAPFFSTSTLTPAQVGQVTTEPSGGAADIGISSPAGEAYRLMIRPQLPDEV